MLCVSRVRRHRLLGSRIGVNRARRSHRKSDHAPVARSREMIHAGRLGVETAGRQPLQRRFMEFAPVAEIPVARHHRRDAIVGVRVCLNLRVGSDAQQDRVEARLGRIAFEDHRLRARDAGGSHQRGARRGAGRPWHFRRRDPLLRILGGDRGGPRDRHGQQTNSNCSSYVHRLFPSHEPRATSHEPRATSHDLRPLARRRNQAVQAEVHDHLSVVSCVWPMRNSIIRARVDGPSSTAVPESFPPWSDRFLRMAVP